MAELIDGKKIAQKVLEEVKAELILLHKRNIKPSLTVVLVGNDPASEIYVNSKEKKANELGILSNKIVLTRHTSERELLELIEKLNKEPQVSAILVQFPLPPQIDERRVRDAISPKKDVDGLNSQNIGKLINGDETLAPCTPKGIARLLKEYNVDVEGKNAVVVGRSLLVGKPIANMLLNRNATVSICHSKTYNLIDYTKNADILVVAVGKSHFITADMVRQGAVVIDVGVNRVKTKSLYENALVIKEDVDQAAKITGDVEFDAVSKKAKLITPVPGGVGPMTIAMLMQNTINCAKLANHIRRLS
ncbi:bifunctional methylenetetrahydrofolate dehydrogenase/methenyltetrahydrofolate cyclohydrolase FolD [Candidatus Micrarchaeota archaeon]|nr:bifunctional methylenetetrahydrofolate dehydrogenase/methenyltetrahydrofolate cyclohydrolase FolD [Candidatus Micrarchaeota archaeon]